MQRRAREILLRRSTADTRGSATPVGQRGLRQALHDPDDGLLDDGEPDRVAVLPHLQQRQEPCELVLHEQDCVQMSAPRCAAVGKVSYMKRLHHISGGAMKIAHAAP